MRYAHLSYEDIKSFKILSGFKVRFTFTDGKTRTLDLDPYLRGPVFRPVRRSDYFRKAFLDHGVISWPNGADIAPETIYHGLSPTCGPDCKHAV